MKTYHPLFELTMARVREFIREPAAIFWVYCFPLIMAVSLGIAFREKPIEKITVDIRTDTGSTVEVEALKAKLASDERIKINDVEGDAWIRRLGSGKTDLVVASASNGSFELWDEPNRTESVLARHAVERVLYKPANGAPDIRERHLDETGNRYIDFLLPGLLGMNLMGGGLFGIGFALTDMRVRKLLKRFLATPMRRSHFLLSIALSRMLFTVPEVLFLLGFGYFAFEVKNQGSFLTLTLLIVLGAASFGGLGLLIGSRAKTLEAVSGLMNMIMLPMWVLSGVFFSHERFPDIMQPFIRALPLTALNDALRAVMHEGKGLFDLPREIGTLVAWGVVSYAVAFKIFRWR